MRERTITVEFVDELPQPRAARRAELDAAVEELKRRPGQWAKVREGVNTGMAQVFSNRGCETATRNNRRNSEGKPVGDIYARWPEGGER